VQEGVQEPSTLGSTCLNLMRHATRLSVNPDEAGQPFNHARVVQEKGFSTHDAYSTSKLCNQIFNVALAKRLKAAGEGLRLSKGHDLR